jgi:LPXTG-motif cell wall-anchored protein
MVKDEHARNTASAAHDGVEMSRRAFVRRSGTVGLGAAAVWSAPSIRTTVLGPGATGTPAPETHTQSESTPPAPTDAPIEPTAATTGRLPMTGTNPRGLLVAGGAAIAAGGALLSVSNDPEPTRRQD